MKEHMKQVMMRTRQELYFNELQLFFALVLYKSLKDTARTIGKKVS